MKKFLFLLILCVAGFFYWRSQQPTPPVRHLAPPGTYFVLQYESFSTDHGIVAFTPGQEVHLVSSAPSTPGMLTVTDGQYNRAMNIHALTNDLDLAASLRESDESAQAAARSKIASDLAQAEARKHAAEIAAAKDLQAANARAPQTQRPIVTPKPPPTPPQNGPRDAYGRLKAVPETGRSRPTPVPSH